ncbi:MAG: hypothetical protein M0Q38_07345 [Bacteroidales bacterium]|nr:hypothetical protein [Bacteroidales bacterium]
MERSIIAIVLILNLLVPAAGCRQLLGFKYGMTQPREETPEKLILFLEKEKFPMDNMYLFPDSLSWFQALRNPVFRKNMLSHMVFDHEGQLLERDTAQCQWSGYDFIRTLDRDSSYRKIQGFQINNLLGQIKPFGGHSESVGFPLDPDFTIVITWAKFIGTYNKRLFVLSRAVSENRSAKIRLIYLNIDMQESWNLTKKQKVAIQ